MDTEKLLTTISELGATWGLRIVGVIVMMVVAWIVAGWANRTINRALTGRKFDETLTRFFAKLARYAILTGAVLGCLGVFGVQTASFAAVVAAAGLAIGLAFQGTLSNFAAGVMLLVFRPFKVGQYVVVEGSQGVVDEIELFTTQLTTLDNRKIILPNSAVFGTKIENYTHHDVRRVDIDVGVTYSADTKETRRVLEAAAKSVRGAVAEPAPTVFLKGLGGSSVDWQMRIWCKSEDYWAIWEETVDVTKRALDDADISIPFPQLDVHFDGPVITNGGN